MALPDFLVAPAALVTYGSTAVEQYEVLSQAKNALAQVQIPSGSFGKLPESDSLHSSYNDHATADQQNISDLMDCLQYIGEALAATAVNYLENEGDLAGLFGGGQ
jgi:hypothetical protein